MRAESREVKRDRCSAPDIMIDALYRESVQRRCPKRPGLFKTGKMAIHRSLRRSCFPDGTHVATTRPASLHLRARARKLTKLTEDYKTYIKKRIQTTRKHPLKQKSRTCPFLRGGQAAFGSAPRPTKSGIQCCAKRGPHVNQVEFFGPCSALVPSGHTQPLYVTVNDASRAISTNSTKTKSKT